MKQLTSKVKPDEIILVIDGNIGQTAYNQAQAFAQSTPVGSIIVLLVVVCFVCLSGDAC